MREWGTVVVSWFTAAHGGEWQGHWSLDDGSIWSVYYQIDQPGEKTMPHGHPLAPVTDPDPGSDLRGPPYR